ncbi:hypothetical protein [Chitinimonas sp.]|uniref:hypothetical protein n=1 Tax=Chitinimonas sp. TaxID=1934313 RepID=UPI002F91FD7C
MRLIALTLTTLASLVALAAPAPWYIWQSPSDRTTVCAQTSPGDGWTQARGPFKDSLCRQLGQPG